MTKRGSRKNHTKRLRPIYQLAPAKRAKLAEEAHSSRNKENEGFRSNAIFRKKSDLENVKKGFLKEKNPNEADDQRMSFVLKSSEISYEKSGVFGEVPFPRKKPKIPNMVKWDQNHSTGNTPKNELVKEKQVGGGSVVLDKLGPESPNLDEKVSGPPGLSLHKDLMVETGESGKFSLFTKIPKISVSDDHSLNTHDGQKSEKFSFSNESLGDMTSNPDAYFIKPILDILRESDTPDMYIHEELQSKYQVIDPGQAGSPGRTEQDFCASPNSDSHHQPRPCFLDENKPLKKPKTSAIKSKTQTKKTKRVLSLKEKFKRLNELKKLNKKENLGKMRATAEPFHPTTKTDKFGGFQATFNQSSPGFFFGGAMNFAQTGFFPGGMELDHFPHPLHKFRFQRHSFKYKSKPEAGFYRKEHRSHRPSASEKTEDYSNKYKTEICKNFELTGKCQWREMVGKRTNESVHSRTGSRS